MFKNGPSDFTKLVQPVRLLKASGSKILVKPFRPCSKLFHEYKTRLGAEMKRRPKSESLIPNEPPSAPTTRRTETLLPTAFLFVVGFRLGKHQKTNPKWAAFRSGSRSVWTIGSDGKRRELPGSDGEERTLFLKKKTRFGAEMKRRPVASFPLRIAIRVDNSL